MNINEIQTPFYVVYEDRLRSNLELISEVRRRAGVDVIMAFKANALWRTFGIVRESCRNSTASSLAEKSIPIVRHTLPPLLTNILPAVVT